MAEIGKLAVQVDVQVADEVTLQRAGWKRHVTWTDPEGRWFLTTDQAIETHKLQLRIRQALHDAG